MTTGKRNIILSLSLSIPPTSYYNVFNFILIILKSMYVEINDYYPSLSDHITEINQDRTLGHNPDFDLLFLPTYPLYLMM